MDAACPTLGKGFSNEEVATFFDLLPQPAVVMDRNHTILHLNSVAAQAAGRSRESCIGARFWEIFDCPECRQGTCAAARAIQTESTVTGESLALVQGKRLAVRITAAPRYDGNHRVVGCIEIINDAGEDMRFTKALADLVEGVREGRLSERIPVDRFQGESRKTLEGVNAMLEAIVVKLNVATEYARRISVGDLPGKITEE